MADFFISEPLFADDCELVAHSVNNSQFTIDDFPYVTHPSMFSVNLKGKHHTNQTSGTTACAHSFALSKISSILLDAFLDKYHSDTDIVRNCYHTGSFNI